MSFPKKSFDSSQDRVNNITPKPDETEMISLYIFNSNKIDETVSGMYGAYAQNQVLSALYTSLQPAGGWKSVSGFGLMGCHGDLFDKDIFGKPTGTTVLREWLKMKSRITSRIGADFLDQLTVDHTKLDYVPYAIGIWPMPEFVATSTHKNLLSSNAVGYLGSFSLQPNARLPFVDTRLSSMHEAGLSETDAIFAAIASTLCLSTKMGIRTSGQSFGWLISDTEHAALRLSKIEQIGDTISEIEQTEDTIRWFHIVAIIFAPWLTVAWGVLKLMRGETWCGFLLLLFSAISFGAYIVMVICLTWSHL